jgi:hypothetical protein
MFAYIAMLAIQAKTEAGRVFGLAAGMLVFALSFATLLAVKDPGTVHDGVREQPRDFYYETRGRVRSNPLSTSSFLNIRWEPGCAMGQVNYFGVPASQVLCRGPASRLDLDGGLPLWCCTPRAGCYDHVGAEAGLALPDPTDRLWASAVVAPTSGRYCWS